MRDGLSSLAGNMENEMGCCYFFRHDRKSDVICAIKYKKAIYKHISTEYIKKITDYSEKSVHSLNLNLYI